MLFKPLSHQGGVLTAFLKRSKKLQIAQVRAVQSPAPLWERFEDAEQSPRTPCGGVCFEHVQNKRRGLAFVQRVRQRAMGRCGNAVVTSRAQWARCGCAVCTLYRRHVNPVFGFGVCIAF